MEQLLVAAACSNLSPVHHYDEVGIPDSGKTMGNNNAGPVWHDLLHGTWNGLLCAGIHMESGLVQNQNFRVGYKGTGNRQKLSLPVAPTRATFLQEGTGREKSRIMGCPGP